MNELPQNKHDGRQASDELFPRGKLMVLSGDPVTRDLLEVILKRHGFGVVAPTDPDEARSALRTREFSAVFIDVRPALFGIADFRELIPAGDRTTKLVLLIDERDRKIFDEIMAGKVEAILTCPFEDGSLLRVAERVVGCDGEKGDCPCARERA